MAGLRDELGLSGPAFETELDPTGGSGPLSPETVLGVAVSWRAGRPVLTLRHRREVLDVGAASRIVGYHLAALAHMVADPESPHGEAGLVGPAELRAQVDGLAGPRRELPDLRLPDLFAMRAATHPDRVAAEHGDQVLTYAALDDRVNRIGHALLDRGLRPEDVVAVVTGRTLDWMASVLAVLRAGGTYLPIEPHFPADRIAAMLRRSGCRLALTEPGHTATFDLAREKVPGISVIPLDTVDQARPISPLLVPVRAHQQAYLYFTSGSTGEPKGALCEHAGMLNHLYAKVHDLGLREGAVVAQTAPQCFDISLWQLVSALLVGGRTVLIDQDAILDVDRFLDTLVDHRVEILQIVPSYLDVVLSRLEAEPRDLPDLRCVSVTGEALPRDLVRRWFGARPGIPLVNAYGLTETSDDTNHEVMWHDPDDDRVPLGRPIANVHVYVVDEQLRPVPLGAPGEIVFSGVCVGLATSTTPTGLLPHSSMTRCARENGSTAAVMSAAGGRTASWSTSVVATPRSRCAASGSSSARSRRPLPDCRASGRPRWWWTRVRVRPDSSRSSPAIPVSRPTTCAVRIGRLAAAVHGALAASAGGRSCR